MSSLNAKYGLKQVVNASGRMSILGVSAPTDSVMEAMKTGGQNYVEMADLVDKAGTYIAEKLGAEAAVAVNSASSGIALSVAAVVTKGKERASLRLHQEPILDNEVIIMKGHNVQYGAPIETMIALGGGKIVEAGYANEGKPKHLEECISERTAAILYVQSHHCVQKNMLSVQDAWQVAKRAQIPFIVDAAAEEDLRFYASFADLAIYSGSKALEGPTSGIVAGKKKYIDWLKVQLHGVGRSMKVGKESVFGLLQALDEYENKQDNSEREKEMLHLLMPLEELEGVRVSIVQDEAGRKIFRARVQIDPTLAKCNAEFVAGQLQNGNPAIYTRDYGTKQGFFDIDPRSLKNNDIAVITQRMQEILGGIENGRAE